MRNGLYPRLAFQNLRKNRRFYLPYLLAVMGLSAAFYVMSALVADPGVGQLRGAEYVRMMMSIGMVVAGLFSAVLLLYINSFLMKQRKKELGLYNILGMGKGNIALIQCWESLYTAVIGIGGGLVLGVAFHWAATRGLTALLRFSTPFSAALSPAAMAGTALFFGALLALALVINLGRVRLANPIELLRGGDVGEREPRTRWLLSVVGVAALGAGYAIAMVTADPISAMTLYFLAVLLVIIGTYCLFTAVSIALLKLLRKNKNFYYKTSHFIGVSGMLYRMKRNAVGLANICILSTMVMVMLSGTLSLYLGTGEIIDAQYPGDFQLEGRYAEPGEGDEPFNGPALAALAEDYVRGQGFEPRNTRTATYLNFTVTAVPGGFQFGVNGERDSRRTIYFLTAADYQALTGNPAPALGPGEAALCGVLPEGVGDVVSLQAMEKLDDGRAREMGEPMVLDVVEKLPSIDYFRTTFDAYETTCLILPDREALSRIYRLQIAAYGEDYGSDYRFLAMLDLDAGNEEQLALVDGWYDLSMDEHFFDGTGTWSSLFVTARAEMEVDGYGMAGGFLFLGILLGIIFLMATALIIYYKQVSEGYEDQGRFEIMRKVGLSQREVRASIRSQVLMVFFLPILVAAVHILFDFNLVVQLLSLFSVRSVLITALCTGGTLLVFLAVYGAVYLLTARTYYKIVR